MRRVAFVLVSLGGLIACQPATVALTDTALTDTDLTAIRELGTSYATANVAMDADAVAALYTEDAIEMPPNEPATEGRAAIRERYASYLAADAETTEFTVVSVEIDGMDDLAFDRGTWSWTGTPPGMAEPMTETGKYLSIARRQADGSWLWSRVIWNSDLPLPEPE
ncbi:MAG: SgcJ/EcaC family oxidoreductase [Gemmatimonadota bacterium]|jgi:uncharacterized protein (TIGR02246 family)